MKIDRPNAVTISEALALFDEGLRPRAGARIAGLDEAGRGPLAGPVVAAAVVLPGGAPIEGVNDSKQLSARSREKLFDEIRTAALAWSIVLLDAGEIDRLNIRRASLAAMARALADLRIPDLELALIDGRDRIETPLPQRSIIGGDAKSYHIACASILAKVHRDRLMIEFDALFPGYGFALHKGYGTAAHLAALEKLGPCPIHRQSYAPVARLLHGVRHGD